MLASGDVVVTLRDLNARGPIRPSSARRFETPSAPPWRWLALLAIVAACAHRELHELGGWIGLDAHLARLGGVLVPVQSVFVAWGVILLVLGIYGVAQLGDQQRRLAVYDRVSRHVVLVCALASLALAVLAAPSLGGVERVAALIAAASCAMAVVAASAYLRVGREVEHGAAPRVVLIPFALVLGFSTILASAALDGAIRSAGVAASTHDAFAVALVVAIAGLASVLGFRHRDAVLPGFVAWSFAGIATSAGDAVLVTGAAVLAAGTCTMIAVLVAATRVGAPAPDPRARSMRLAPR